jgi:hypothetical protein
MGKGLRTSLLAVVVGATVVAPATTAVVSAGGFPALSGGASVGSGMAQSPGVVGVLRGPSPSSSTGVLVDRLNAASMRARPVLPPTDVPRQDMTWVPDRYVPVTGAPGGALVPGHWEQRLPGGDVYTPPLTIIRPDGGSQLAPAGAQSAVGPHVIP